MTNQEIDKLMNDLNEAILEYRDTLIDECAALDIYYQANKTRNPIKLMRAMKSLEVMMTRKLNALKKMEDHHDVMREKAIEVIMKNLFGNDKD